MSLRKDNAPHLIALSIFIVEETIFEIDDSAHNPEKENQWANVRLWISRNKAVIVTIANNIEGRSIFA